MTNEELDALQALCYGGVDLANGPDMTAYPDGRIEPNPEWCGPQTTKEDNQ